MYRKSPSEPVRKMNLRIPQLIAVMAGLILSLAWLGGSPTTGAIVTASAHTTLTSPTPDETLLVKEEAATLIGDLKESLESAVEDEAAFNKITEKWGSRNLVGKSRKQAIEILLADVKSVVKDAEVTSKLLEEWNSTDEGMDESDDSKKVDDKDKSMDDKEDADDPADKKDDADTPNDKKDDSESKKDDVVKPADDAVVPSKPTDMVTPVPRAATMGGGAGVLDAARKKSLGGMEAATFRSHTAGIVWVKEPGIYKKQWYSIFKDSADPELAVKVAAAHLAVKTIIDKGLKLPYDLRIYCTAKYEAQNRAYPRDDKWNETSMVVLRWALDPKAPSLGSVSQMKFSGFNRPAITTIHEIGHILHERSAGDMMYFGKGSTVVDGKAATAGKVSNYAGNSRKEFVAEVFAGLILGKKWPAAVLAEYNSYKGPSVP